MNLIFKPTEQFKKSFKRLYKKFPSLPSDYKNFEEEFSKNLELGVDLGGGFRKIRMAIASKNRGKSGGARIITYEMCIKKQDNTIVLVDIYDKNEQETIQESKYKSIIETFLAEE
jgi:hypothetical protein